MIKNIYMQKNNIKSRLTEDGHNKHLVVGQLCEGIKGVLQHPPRVGAEDAGRDPVEGDQEQGKRQEPEETWGRLC